MQAEKKGEALPLERRLTMVLCGDCEARITQSMSFDEVFLRFVFAKTSKGDICEVCGQRCVAEPLGASGGE
jgi:hypothetical protein